MSSNDQITPVRCYGCGHRYGAVLNRIDTRCPQCGSDSFTRDRATEETP